jgi:prepilin-type processing-associated H-X9-DG protein
MKGTRAVDYVEKTSDLKSTSRSLLAMESKIAVNPNSTNEAGDHLHNETWFVFPWPRNWNEMNTEVETRRHGSTSNYLFADGHVEAIDAEALMERARKARANENFTAPNRY